MRTQDWKATNTPSGPPLTLRCACGAVLVTLAAGGGVAHARHDATDIAHRCHSCHKVTRIGVHRAG